MTYAENRHLLSLLQLYGIKHDNSLESIVKATQRKQHEGGWLRSTEERYQIKDTELPAPRELIYSLCEKLGFINEKPPVHQQYNYALLLGGELETTRIRLAYLCKLWNNGVRFEELFFLCSQRPLFPIENFNTFHNINNGILRFNSNWQTPFTPQIFETQTKAEELNEYTLTQLLYKQADIPSTLRAVPTQFLGTPMKISNDGMHKRPNTADTIIDWLKTNPKPGNCLAISDQPQLLYQDSVLKTLLPLDFPVETVGAAAQVTTQIGEMLDALARYLYQEHERLPLL